MFEPTVQFDPLNSPHPIPWEWVIATHTEISTLSGVGVRYYRSPSLVSPDGLHAAYSRIQMRVHPELYLCRVSSVMFVENLQTGQLQTVTPASPLAEHPFSVSDEVDMPGAISMLIPVAWNETGDRILGRVFEAIFCTSDMSDYAVVWEQNQNRTYTVAPAQSLYTHAVLLGWSASYPDEVLFRAGNLGDRIWPVCAVDLNGRTMVANQDQPLLFGRQVSAVKAGPHAP